MLDLSQQPRWGAAYLNTSSLSYKLPIRGLFYPLKEVEQSAYFCGPLRYWDVSEPTSFLFLRDTATMEEGITLSTTIAESTALNLGFKRAKSLEDLKYSKEPSYYFKAREGYFVSNSEEITVEITSTTTGTFDISSQLLSTPPTEDSYFLIEGSGNQPWVRVYPDQNGLFSYKAGTFNLKYLSEDLRAEILAHTSNLQLNSVNTTPEVHLISNIWDTNVKVFGYLRCKNFSNTDLSLIHKKYCLSRKTENQIAIVLGLGLVLAWNSHTSNPLNFSTEYNSIEFPNNSLFTQSRISPIESGGSYYTAQGFGYWETKDKNILDYDEADTDRIGARRIWSRNIVLLKDSYDKIIGVRRDSGYPRSYIGLTQTSVQIEKVTRTKKIRWGNPILSGEQTYEYT